MSDNSKFTTALVVVGAVLLALAMAGCTPGDGLDLTPIGNGLGVIGLGIVLAAFIRVLGEQWNKPPERRKTDAKPK